MSMRLQEVHPAMVHAPLTLLPLAVGADLVGRMTGSPTAYAVGRTAIVAAAGTAVLAAASGLIAQEEVRAEGLAHDRLVTHRNLNLAVTAAGGVMAAWRAGRERPGWGYIAAGLSAIGVALYTAYLGGKMVYEHGVGVEAANGLARGEAPALAPGEFRHAMSASVEDLRRGVPRTWRQVRDGEIAPSLRHPEPIETAPTPTDAPGGIESGPSIH